MKRKNKFLKEDKEWSLAIKERDKVCQICSKSDGILNAHHIIPKQFREFRFNLDNGILLCFQHHRGFKYSAHQNAVWFSEWLRIEKPKIFSLIKEKFAFL